jgi:hypothetical protein
MSKGKIIAISLVTVASIILLTVGVFVLRVVLSDPVGEGNAIIQKNSANNRIAAQERFESLYQEVVSSDQKITAAQQALDLTPDDKTLKQNLNGIINYCISVRAEYNAEARKFSSEDFRSADLPYQIDEFSFRTDCKA